MVFQSIQTVSACQSMRQSWHDSVSKLKNLSIGTLAEQI